MNHDEFAFLNHQLAAMLKEGIPLEGALRKLCEETGRGQHQAAFRKVEEELQRGIPLPQAIENAKLPDFYREMVRLGVAAGDLPGVLTLTADYYRRVGAIWTRLRALLTYPFLVLGVSLLLSLWFAALYHDLNREMNGQFANQPSLGILGSPKTRETTETTWWLNLWVPPVLMTAAILVGAALLAVPAVRAQLRWRLGPFKDASLAQLASALNLLIRQGLPLRESLAFAARMEAPNGAGEDLQRWIARHAEGHARFSDVAAGSITVPSLFIWIVSSAGDDLAAGFAHAAELYGERARRRAEILLNLVLPCALLALGLMIMGQIQPFVTSVFDIFTPIFKAKQIIGP
jgi:type II secretory pathway component PulF